MSIIRAIKHRLGLSVTPANNFVLDASADNGTMKLARESGQDIMTVDAAGKVGFTAGILGFQYIAGSAANRALKFPAWLGSVLVQWGIFNFTYTTSVQTHTQALLVPFAVPHNAICKRNGSLGSANSPSYDEVSSVDTHNIYISFVTSGTNVSADVSWLAIGTY